MVSISIENLLKFNREGLIPGPNESEEEFKQRVSYCLNLKNAILAELKDKIPFHSEEMDYDTILSNPLEEACKSYDVAPHWVPVFFSNQKLFPWHGGCAWIFKSDEGSPTSAFLQLRRNLKYAPKYLGIYRRDELITHEFCHISRMLFEEPKFEEILSYRLSSSRLRSYLGGLFQSGAESALFAFAIGSVFLLDLGTLLSGQPGLYMSLMWMKLIPLLILLYFFVRLCFRQRQLNKTLKKLHQIYHDNAPYVLFRLTDREIQEFAKMRLNDIQDYITTNRDQSPRWKVIHEAYCKLKEGGATVTCKR